MRPPNEHSEDICRDRIMEGVTQAELCERYDLSRSQIIRILKLPENEKYITKYKQMRDEIAKDAVESVKKQAALDSEEFYDRLKAMALQRDTVECPACNHEIRIDVANTTVLRAILSGMGIAGIKIKQDEDIQRDLPQLKVQASEKKVKPMIEKQAG